MKRQAAIGLPAAVVLALTPLAGDGRGTSGTEQSTLETSTMSITPSSSRPPAPVVPPAEHAGIRYEQDRTDERKGDQSGGYLVARDAKTGEQRWRLKIYDVADHRPAGVEMGGIYFRSMYLLPSGDVLEIENEVGSVYRVDLTTHEVEKRSGPPDEGAPPPTKPKPKPTPE